MEGRGIGEQLSTNFVRCLGTIYVTFHWLNLALHRTNRAEYVILIVLVFDPQVNRLPVYGPLGVGVIGGMIVPINGDVWFQRVQFILESSSINKVELGTETGCLDCTDL